MGSGETKLWSKNSSSVLPICIITLSHSPFLTSRGLSIFHSSRRLVYIRSDPIFLPSLSVCLHLYPTSLPWSFISLKTSSSPFLVFPPAPRVCVSLRGSIPYLFPPMLTGYSLKRTIPYLNLNLNKSMPVMTPWSASCSLRLSSCSDNNSNIQKWKGQNNNSTKDRNENRLYCHSKKSQHSNISNHISKLLGVILFFKPTTRECELSRDSNAPLFPCLTLHPPSIIHLERKRQ